MNTQTTDWNIFRENKRNRKKFILKAYQIEKLYHVFSLLVTKTAVLYISRFISRGHILFFSLNNFCFTLILWLDFYKMFFWKNEMVIFIRFSHIYWKSPSLLLFLPKCSILASSTIFLESTKFVWCVVFFLLARWFDTNVLLKIESSAAAWTYQHV